MKSKGKKIAALFILLLAVGFYLDHTQSDIIKNNQIERGSIGEAEEQYLFELDAGGVLEDYDYALTVDAQLPSEEEIRETLDRAKEEIAEGFCRRGDEMSYVTQDVIIESTYAEGLVEAEWTFSNYDVVDCNGKLQEEAIPEEGIMVEALVELSCYGIGELYSFSFMVFPRERSRAEQLLADIDADIGAQLKAVGKTHLVLPERIGGVELHWSQKKEHYFWKIVFLEVIFAVSLMIGKKDQEKKEHQKRQQQMRLDYPEIVSKILVLTGAGMSIRQAWNKISASYSAKRDKKQLGEREAYRNMVITNREIMDGESERIALQRFGDRVGLSEYRRFSRLLVDNLEKGARGMEVQLEREASEAFEERKRIARKLGEEAGTKMLIPMMLSLAMVMAVIIVPAIMSFQG